MNPLTAGAGKVGLAPRPSGAEPVLPAARMSPPVVAAMGVLFCKVRGFR